MTTGPSNQGAMKMSNIDRFNEVSAQIFAQLFEEFPEKTEIEFRDLLTPDEDGGVDDHDIAFVRDTAVWLHEAGYIWGGVTHTGLMMAVLSPKGLEALKATPASLATDTDAPQSIGDALISAVQGGSWDAVQALTREAFLALVQLGGAG